MSNDVFSNTDFTLQQLRMLEKAYPVKDIRPGTALDRVMFDAGIQAVISYVRARVKGYNRGLAQGSANGF